MISQAVVSPCPTTSISTSNACSGPSIGAPYPSTGPSTTCFTPLSSPSARRTSWLDRMGTRAAARRTAQAAPRIASDGLPRIAGARRAHCPRVARSATAATSAPDATSPLAAASRRGPQPATTTRFPGCIAWLFNRIVAAASPITPGSVHPENGATRSWAPVATTAPALRTRSNLQVPEHRRGSRRSAPRTRRDGPGTAARRRPRHGS